MLVIRARKTVLVEYWESRRRELVEKYQKMNKKHRLLANKLNRIDTKLRDKIIDDHYHLCRFKFILALRKLVQSLKPYYPRNHIENSKNVGSYISGFSTSRLKLESKATVEVSNREHFSMTKRGDNTSRILSETNISKIMTSKISGYKRQRLMINKARMNELEFKFIPEEQKLIYTMIQAAEGKYDLPFT